MPKVTVEISDLSLARLNALHEARNGPVTTDGVVHYIDDVICLGIGCVTEELPQPTYTRYRRHLEKALPNVHE